MAQELAIYLTNTMIDSAIMCNLVRWELILIGLFKTKYADKLTFLAKLSLGLFISLITIMNVFYFMGAKIYGEDNYE